MADIFRAPLFAARREVAPVLQLGAALVGPALLVTLLGVTPPAPFVNAPHFAPNATRVKAWLPADTSTRRSPLFVREEGTTPFFVASHFTPSATRVKNWVPADRSTQRSPLTFREEGTTPFFVPAHFTPSATRVKNWLPADTSQLSQVQLIPTGPQPLPPGEITPTPLHRFFWQPPDSSASVAKPLFADSTVPFAVLQQPVLDRVRPVTNTSAGTPTALLPVVVVELPPGETSFAASPERPRQISDTTADTWVGLLSVALPPGVATYHAAPQRSRWLPANTTQRTPKVTFADAQLPTRTPQHTQPDRRRPVADTSQSAFAAVHPVVIVSLPPGRSLQLSPQAVRWIYADASRGTIILPPAAVIPPGVFDSPQFTESVSAPTARIGDTPDGVGNQRIGTTPDTGTARIGGAPITPTRGRFR